MTELSKVTMILRGYTYEQVREVAEVLLNAKYVRNMEITMNTEGAVETIRKIAAEYGDRLNVGAGTVQYLQELKQVQAAGAVFALSPRMMSKEMLDFCKEHNMVSVPAGFTPSEVGELFDNGADIVKVFPANELSLSYARKLCEPMGDLKLMAVGGINKNNVREAFESGYQYVGSAGGIFRKEDIKAGNLDSMRKTLKEFEEQLD